MTKLIVICKNSNYLFIFLIIIIIIKSTDVTGRRHRPYTITTCSLVQIMAAVEASVNDYMKRRGISLSRNWLKACIESIRQVKIIFKYFSLFFNYGRTILIPFIMLTRQYTLTGSILISNRPPFPHYHLPSFRNHQEH